MQTENAWQRSAHLTKGVLQVTSGLDLPRGDWWPTVVTTSLDQANELLDSIRLLLDKNHRYSAVILTRSLFELAVTLAYIAKDVSKRLPSYLRHGSVPTTNEEAEKLQEKVQKLRGELGRGDAPNLTGILPRWLWKPVRDMCSDLGPDSLKEYETLYRFTSVPTHAGSLTVGHNYIQLLKQQAPSDCDKANVLVTALDLHLRVAEVAADVFPGQIELEKLKEMRLECQKLGQSLARRFDKSLPVAIE